MTASYGLFSIQIQITWSTVAGGVATVPQGPSAARRRRAARSCGAVESDDEPWPSSEFPFSEEPSESAVEPPRSTSAKERIPALTLLVTSSESTTPRRERAGSHAGRARDGRRVRVRERLLAPRGIRNVADDRIRPCSPTCVGQLENGARHRAVDRREVEPQVAPKHGPRADLERCLRCRRSSSAGSRRRMPSAVATRVVVAGFAAALVSVTARAGQGRRAAAAQP